MSCLSWHAFGHSETRPGGERGGAWTGDVRGIRGGMPHGMPHALVAPLLSVARLRRDARRGPGSASLATEPAARLLLRGFARSMARVACMLVLQSVAAAARGIR